MVVQTEPNDRSHLGVIHDSQIKVETGPCYQKLLKSPDCSFETSNWDGKKLLSIGEVKELWKDIHGAKSLQEMESTPRKKVYLHELLMDSELLLPKLEIPKRNPELEKRITALRNSLAEKEYQRMTHNVNFTSQHKPEDTIGFHMKQMNSAMIAVFQFVISIACAFFFGFKGIELFLGELQLPVRLLLGIGAALIVGAAELYFLAVNIAMNEESYSTSDSNLPKPLSFQGKSIISPKQHLKTS